MSFHNIEKRSAGYWLLFQLSRLIHNNLYYSNIYIKGKENIPVKEPVIFAINHQNALMDALAILYSSNGRKVFMARADIFQKPKTAKILYFLKILPIYRIRDGFSNLKENDKSFTKTLDVIQHNIPLVMLPEGTHEGVKMLRPLKKGLARFALNTQAEGKLVKSIQIIPVGLDYSDYLNIRSELVITYGKPIFVADYMAAYTENEPKAINKLNQDLFARLKELVIHTANQEDNDLLLFISAMKFQDQVADDEAATPGYNEYFTMARQLISELVQRFEKEPAWKEVIQLKIKKYRETLAGAKLFDRQLAGNNPSAVTFFIRMAFLFLLLPLFIAGAVLHLPLYYLPEIKLRKLKDIMFTSSFRFVLWIILVPLFYILYFVLAFIISGQLLYALAFIILLPLSGIFSWHYLQLIRKHLSDMRFYFMKRKKNPIIDELSRLRKEIMSELN